MTAKEILEWMYSIAMHESDEQESEIAHIFI